MLFPEVLLQAWDASLEDINITSAHDKVSVECR